MSRDSYSNCFSEITQLYQDGAREVSVKEAVLFHDSQLLLCEITEVFDMDYAQVYGNGLAHHVCTLLALLFYVFNAFILIFEKNSWITITEMKIKSIKNQIPL